MTFFSTNACFLLALFKPEYRPLFTMELPLHPQAERLENCLEALHSENRRKVRTTIHLVNNLADYLAGHRPKPGRTHAQKRVTVNTGHLPRGASHVAVEYQPFRVAQEAPNRHPWYVMYLDRSWLGQGKRIPETPQDAEKNIAQVFGPLIKKHRLLIRKIAENHWNLANKSGNKTFALSVMNGKLMLVADRSERLLEMANHYFHDAQPVGKQKPKALRVSANLVQITEPIEPRKTRRLTPRSEQLELEWDEKAA